MQGTGEHVDQPVTEEESEHDEETLLDRGLSLPRVSISTTTITATLAFAALVRLLGLDRWGVGLEEARIALAARAIVTGDGPIEDLAGHPTTVDFVALIMFLGHTTESIGRVAVALTGIALVAGVLFLRNRIGHGPSIAAAALIATSPTLIATSRSMDGGAIALALLVGVLVLAQYAPQTDDVLYPALAGALLGGILMASPSGPITVLIGVGLLAATAPSGWWEHPRRAALGIVAGTAASVIVLGTALLTRPGELGSSLQAMFRSLWNEHLSNASVDFHLPIWNLILNEPLIVVLAVYAAIRVDWPFVRTLATWSVAALVIGSLLSFSTPAGYGIVVLPLALLAGFGAWHLIDQLPVDASRRWPAIGFVASVLLLVFAFVSVVLLAGDDTRSTGSAIAQFLLIVAVAVVPLAFAISALSARLEGHRLRLLGLAGLVLIAGFTARSAVLTASERPGQPGEILYANAMSPGLPTLVDTIHNVSRDLTRTERSAQMPVGGVGLDITVDERFAETFAWYFREYPEFHVIDPTEDPLPEGTQLAILRDGLVEQSIAPGLRGQSYEYHFEPAATFTDPSWENLASNAFSIDGWRRWVDYLIHRDLTVDPTPIRFRVLATPQIADRIFADTGPYALDERAGPGRAAGQFIQPRGIAVDGDGRIYVVDAGNGRIQRFAPDETHELTFGEPGSGPGQLGLFENGPGGAGGITIGRDGNVYVADTWNHRITVFTSDGEYVRSWGAFFDAGDQLDDPTSQSGMFYGPRGITADGSGLLYVTDTGNERVQVFTETGEFVTAFGQPGSQPGNLLEPVGISIGPSGEILVADSHNERIARFEPDGTPLDPWPVDAWSGQRFFEPYLTVTDAGIVVVTSSGTGEVVLLDERGNQIDLLTGADLQRPYGVAVRETDSSLLVSDGQLGVVLELPLNVGN